MSWKQRSISVKMNMRKTIIAILFSISALQASDWKIMHGKFVTLEFNPGLEFVADSLVNIADRAIPRLCALHGLPLSSFDEHKTRIILTDAPDIPNGYAIENAVVIYARSSMLLNIWSGPHTWYKMVLEHELAHHITFRAIRRIDGYFGVLSSLSTPRWFFEGTAQYFAETWTSSRGDIYMREAVLNGQLNYNSLFNLNNGAMVYAAGHAFIRYLADQYGDSSLKELVNYEKDGFSYNFNNAFKHVYKKEPREEYKFFIRHMVTYYGNIAANYPKPMFDNILPAFGFYDLQIIPLSTPDSTYLVSTVLEENHLFKSAVIYKIKNGKKHLVKEITSNFISDLFLSPDKNFVAYGQLNLETSLDQMQIDFKWNLFNISTGQTKNVIENIRSFNTTITSENDLIFAESNADSTSVLKVSLSNKTVYNLYATDMAVGKLTSMEDGSIIFEAQNSTGKRDLYRLENENLSRLTNDDQQYKTPIIINDSLLAINQEVNNHPVISIFNLNKNTAQVVVNDQYPIALEAVDRDNNTIVASYPDPLAKQIFVTYSIDSILQNPILPLKDDVDHVYNGWIQKSAEVDSVPASHPIVLKSKTIEDIYFPQGKLINIQTLPIPFYSDGDFGLFVSSLWTEALQRQTILLSSYLIFDDWQSSFVSFLHDIRILDLNFTSVYYHGPGFVTRINDEYEELVHDYALFDISYMRFFSGNLRVPYNLTLSYMADRFQKVDQTLNYSYHGPVISAGIGYTQPSKFHNIFPKKSISVSTGYFKSLRKEWDFSAYSSSISIGSNLFSERLGFTSRLNYTKLIGNISPSAETGIDSDFEYNLPRDFRNTKTLRGINKNIFGKSLLWNSTDLSFILADQTPLKIIVIPINEIAFSTFLDAAKVETTNLFSYGAELSFGFGFLRFSSGCAKGNINGDNLKAGFYGRINVNVDDVFRGLTLK